MTTLDELKDFKPVSSQAVKLEDITDFKPVSGASVALTDIQDFKPVKNTTITTPDVTDFKPVETSNSAEKVKLDNLPVQKSGEQDTRTFGEKLKTAGANLAKAFTGGAKDILTGVAATLPELRGMAYPGAAAPVPLPDLKTMTGGVATDKEVKKATEELRDKSINVISKIPDVGEPGFTTGVLGAAENISTGLVRSALPMAFYYIPGVGEISSLAGIYAQIKGNKYNEIMKKTGNSEAATKASEIAALTETPLEFLGNILMFQGAKTGFKAITSKAKISDKLSDVLHALTVGGLGNGAEETAQAYGDAIASAYGENYDKPAKEIAKIAWDRVWSSEQFKSALAQGGYGVIGGMFLPAMGITLGVATNAVLGPKPTTEQLNKFKADLKAQLAEKPELIDALREYRNKIPLKRRAFRKVVDEVITEYKNPTMYLKKPVATTVTATPTKQNVVLKAGAPKTVEGLLQEVNKDEKLQTLGDRILKGEVLTDAELGSLTDEEWRILTSYVDNSGKLPVKSFAETPLPEQKIATVYKTKANEGVEPTVLISLKDIPVDENGQISVNNFDDNEIASLQRNGLIKTDANGRSVVDSKVLNSLAEQFYRLPKDKQETLINTSMERKRLASQQPAKPPFTVTEIPKGAVWVPATSTTRKTQQVALRPKTPEELGAIPPSKPSVIPPAAEGIGTIHINVQPEPTEPVKKPPFRVISNQPTTPIWTLPTEGPMRPIATPGFEAVNEPSMQLKVQPTDTPETVADSLGIRYNGRFEVDGKPILFSFTDPVTGGDISAPSLDKVEAELDRVRGSMEPITEAGLQRASSTGGRESLYLNFNKPKILKKSENAKASLRGILDGLVYPALRNLKGKGQITLRDFMDYFHRSKSALTQQTESNKQVIASQLADDIAYWFEQNRDRYTNYNYMQLNKAFQVLAEEYPELLTSKANRDALTIALAVTSNGQAGVVNVKLALKAYDGWKKTGKFDEVGAGKSSKAIKAGLHLVNKLSEEVGFETASKALLRPVKVKDLLEVGFKITGEDSDTVLPAGVVLGPKIGGAYLQNLLGNLQPITMDRWFRYSWNRVTGDTFGPNGEVLKAPRNKQERKWMREVFAETQKILEQKYKIKLDKAIAQAVLWEAEKALHNKLNRQGANAEVLDYEEAARRYLSNARREYNLRARGLGPVPVRQLAWGFVGERTGRTGAETSQVDKSTEPSYQLKIDDSKPVQEPAVGSTYSDIANNPDYTTRNIHIQSYPGSNQDRVLLVQISNTLINPAKPLNERTIEEIYYDQLYSSRSGYFRPTDFWEIPEWQAMAKGMLPNADLFIIRDLKSAKDFLAKSGYKAILFSTQDVTADFIKEVGKSFPGQVILGGYAPKTHFQDMSNARRFDTLEEAAEYLTGKPVKLREDYSLYKGTYTVPRLNLSKGCLHRCAFCSIEKLLKMTDKEVVDSQVEAFSDLRFRLVYLNDKTFGQAPNYKDLTDIYARLKSKNPEFEGFIIQTTAAQLQKLPDEFLAKSGIKYVELGVESYNDPILKALHKPASEKLIDEAVEKLRRLNIRFIPNIMVGLTGDGWSETTETYQHTLDFLEKNRDIISHLNIYNLVLYEGTELSKILKVQTDTDFNENTVVKSFHTNPEVHEWFNQKVLEFGLQQLGREPFISSDDLQNLELSEPSFVRKMSVPTKTVKTYKLFRTLKTQPGKIFPLFIGKTEPVPIGVWLEAENIPTSGYAQRPGWHSAKLPYAPHLKQDEGRVWAEVEIPADVDWQPIADRSPTKDIKERVPTNGFYKFARVETQGKEWYISGAIKVNRLLSQTDIDAILSKATFQRSLGEISESETPTQFRLTVQEFTRRAGELQKQLPNIFKTLNIPNEFKERLILEVTDWIDPKKMKATVSEANWKAILGDAFDRSNITAFNQIVKSNGTVKGLIRLALAVQNPSEYTDSMLHELIEMQLLAGALPTSDMAILRKTYDDNMELIVEAAVDYVSGKPIATKQPNVVRGIWGRFVQMLKDFSNKLLTVLRFKNPPRTIDDIFMDIKNGKFVNSTLDKFKAREASLMMAGKKAATANFKGLNGASLEYAAGASKEAVWKKWGWIKGVDGKWRFEIDDSQVTYPLLDKVTNNKNVLVKDAKLSDVISHEALFAAYPQLRDFNISIDVFGSNPVKGEFRTKSIKIQAPNVTTAKWMILHEVQHAVQHIEDFARGGNWDQVRTLPEYADWRAKQASKAGMLDILNLGTVSEAYEAYRHLAGEAEARETVNRMHMTAEERSKNVPGYDGIAEDDLIVHQRKLSSYLVRNNPQDVFDEILRSAKEVAPVPETKEVKQGLAPDEIEKAVTKRFEELNNECLTPVDSALDRAAIAFIKTGDLNAYFEQMPNLGELKPEDIFTYDPKSQNVFASLLKIDKDGSVTVKPAIRSSGFYALQEYADQMKNADDLGTYANMYTDPDRLFEQLDGGKAGGVNQLYILGPSNMNTRAKLIWEDQQTFAIHQITEAYNLNNGKKRRAVGQILEYVTGNNAWKKETDKILSMPEIQKLTSNFSAAEQAELVNAALEFRKLFQRWRDNQNHARKLRKQPEIGYIVGYLPAIRESNIWSRVFGQLYTPKNIPLLPDFVTPNQPFNARALARKNGLDPLLREWDIVKLALDYKTTAGKDIFDTNTVHNNKIHAAVLENLGLKNAADFVYRWTAEYFAGSPGRLEKALSKLIPNVVTNTASLLKRGITMSAFSLNPDWNIQQLTSVLMTASRYPIKSNLAGLNYFFDKDFHNVIKRNAFSSVVKSRIGGGAYYQNVGDIATSTVKRIDTSFMDTALKWANFLTSTLEDALTGHAIATAYHDGYTRLGLRGRALWEYASEAGFKTQGAFHKGRLPGVLRAKQIAYMTPFLNYPFEVFNTLRESNIPVLNKLVRKTGLYEDIAMDSEEGKALLSHRIEIVSKLIIGAILSNYITEKLTGRKFWTISTFIPGIGYILGGLPLIGPYINEFNPRSPDSTLVYRSASDLLKGTLNAVKYGDYRKLRKWILTYCHIPAGMQIEKTVQGMEAIAHEGAVTTPQGKTDYTIEPKDYPFALVHGPYWVRSAIEQREEKEKAKEEKEKRKNMSLRSIKSVL